MAEPNNKPDAELVKESSEAIDAIRVAVKETLDVATLMRDRGYTWKQLLAALVMILTGGGIVFVARQPVEPTPIPSPDASVAKALEGIGPAIAKAIDKQTEVLKAPSPPPVPPPQPPTSGLELVPSLREVRVGEAAVFSATCKSDVSWHCEAKCDRLTDGKLAVFIPTVEGEFPIAVSAVIDGKAVVRLAMVRAGKGPRPPPEPEPGPKPPVPTETVFPADGKVRVLIVEETADRTKLSVGQKEAIFGLPVRNWLESNCSVGPDGKTKEYRIWDKDVDARSESAIWQKALARGKSIPTPSIIVSNGKGQEFIGALPTDDALPLLRKVVGQ